MLFGVSTDVGKVREINQDSFYSSNTEDLPFYVVADGMGGHNAGEIASYIAIDIAKQTFLKYKEDLIEGKIEAPEFINKTICQANEKIIEEADMLETCKGMGTTLTMAFILDGELYIGHIGDSRAYLLRDEDFMQLTQDHSLVAELVRKGSISEEEALNHPQRNIITRALGTDQDIKTDIFSRKIKKDDLLLLCTDGLTNMMSNEVIKTILIESKDLQQACDKLVLTANDLGGIDNVTAMLIGIE